METVLDLTDLLGDDLLDGIIDELSLRVGAVSASAARNGDEVTSEYALANADLTLDSPLVAGITDLLISEDPTAPGVGVQVDNLVTGLAGNTGLVNGLLGALGPVVDAVSDITLGAVDLGAPEITLDSNIQETLELLLAEPLTSSSNVLTLDLATGQITVDLEALGGTSAVDPNTDLLTEAAVNTISTELNALLTDVVEQVRTAVMEGLLETAVTVDVDLEVLAPIASINIDGTLNQLLNGEDIADLSVLGLISLPGVETVLQGVLGAVGDVIELALVDVADGVVDTLLADVLADVAGPLTGNLSTILRNRDLLEITLNAQPNPLVAGATNDDPARPNASTGAITNPDEEFTVTGLHVRVLDGLVDLPLARATVNADADWVATDAPTIGDITDQTVTVDSPINDITLDVTPDDADINVTGLPAGVTYNTTTGVISGTPTAVGTSLVTVTATNDAGSDSESFTITVTADDAPAVPTIEPIGDKTGVVGSPIDSFPVLVSPDDADVTVTGLPDGVSYNPETGVISGTPTQVESPTVTITAEIGDEEVTETFVFTITDDADNTPDVAPIDNTTGTVGEEIDPIEIVVTPEDTTVTVEDLPDGLEYDPETGIISGTPEPGTEGPHTVTVIATNDAGTDTETFIIVISPADGSGNGSIGDGSSGNGSSGNGDGTGNGSSEFLQQCLDSPAAGLVGLLAALGAVSAIAGPALEPLLKSIGSAVDQQLRSLRAATSGPHQPAWVQTINRGLNDAANAINHQMVSNALFATAALALVSSPILCSTDDDSGSSAGSSLGSS